MTQPPHGDTTRASSIAAAEAPESDFIGAPPPAELPEWPPVGAYPDEPGHPTPEPATAAAEPVIAAEPVTALTFEPDSAFEPDSTFASSGAETQVIEGVPVWHQPPPTEPFRAQHEKPGEWRTEPPEHLALEHSPPAEVQPGVQHDQPTEAIPLSMLPHSWEVPFDPHATETALQPPPRHKRPFWIAVALVLTLLLCGGGTVSAYLLLRDADSGMGAPDPVSAVNQFMTAVYTQQDPAAAGETVCNEARDEEELTARVEQIKAYASEYDAPSYSWNEPAVSELNDERAMVGVQLTMTTDDEKTAQQRLTFTVVHKTGWLVCDVTG